MSDTAKTIGTKELAKMLKLDPKTLRKHLRAINKKAPGKTYTWKENDPFLKMLPELIKAQTVKGAKNDQSKA